MTAPQLPDEGDLAYVAENPVGCKHYVGYHFRVERIFVEDRESMECGECGKVAPASGPIAVCADTEVMFPRSVCRRVPPLSELTPAEESTSV